jgi:tetratricopeptide (TPR) repeat protein
MGVVYRARDLALGRDVAVKVAGTRGGPSPAAARRFADEARITAGLQHPGIPPVHQAGTTPDGRPFLVMKLVKGHTLDDLLKSGRSRGVVSARGGPPARGSPVPGGLNLVAAFEAVCQAVGYAHARGVIHRDLKPQNVMVGSYAEVQVMDWGLAKVLADGRRPADPADPDATRPVTAVAPTRGADEATEAGSLLGTPAYMAPEQAIGAVDEVDARTDVFGLGGILCAVLTGLPPYTGDSAEECRKQAARARLDDAFARLDACGAEPELVALCKRCLAAEKDRRPAHAGLVAAEVCKLRADADDRARRAELDRVRAEGERARAEAEAREQRKRRRVQLALAAAVGLLLAGGGAFAWWQDKQSNDRRAEQARLEGERNRAEAEKTALALRQQLDDERRAGEERDRLRRNADALAALVGRCEDALRAGDTRAAAAALAEADRRVPEGGGDDFAGRLARCRADLGVLTEFDRVDQFRWTPDGGKRVPASVLAARWRAAFRTTGVMPDGATPEAAARWVAGSLVRDRLVAALDLWLATEPASEVRAVLRLADPDPYRDAVRDAVAARDEAGVAELAGRADALAQPPGFASALGQNPAVPDDRKRAVLRVALRGRYADFSLLFALGETYTGNTPEELAEALRWHQAAVTADPRKPIAHVVLGFALLQRKDLEGALAACREAVELDPTYAIAHALMGYAYQMQGNREGALAAFREAARHDPEQGTFHYAVGVHLMTGGEWRAAEAAFREAVRLDPDLTGAYHQIGLARLSLGDLDGAVASFREGTARSPKDGSIRLLLGMALQRAGDRDGEVAALREAVRVDPTLTPAHVSLGLALLREGDADGAVAALAEAARLQPSDAATADRLRVARRAQGLARRLPAVAAGTDRLASPADAADLADQADRRFHKRYDLAVWLYAAAFAGDPGLTGKYRFDAACAAVRLASGEDPSAAVGWDEAGIALDRAFAWLSAELAGIRGRLRPAGAAVPPDGDRGWAANALGVMRAAPALAAVRDPARRGWMPADERTRWEQFWAEVNALAEDARPAAAPPPRQAAR